MKLVFIIHFGIEMLFQHEFLRQNVPEPELKDHLNKTFLPPRLKKSLNFKLKKLGRIIFFRNNVPILVKMAEVLKFIVINVLKLIRRFSDDFGASGKAQKVEIFFEIFDGVIPKS